VEAQLTKPVSAAEEGQHLNLQLRKRKRITKTARTGRGQETKWEMSAWNDLE
jgi:hypothetical protein